MTPYDLFGVVTIKAISHYFPHRSKISERYFFHTFSYMPQ